MPTKNSLNFCSYAGCKKQIPSNHFLCAEHHEDYKSQLINECPKCGRFKNTYYKYCADCQFGRPVKRIFTNKQIKAKMNSIAIEHSPAWEKADKEAIQFFVYILKLNDGKFYVGHSREPRVRLYEHLDGETSIKGLNPKLKYFEILSSRVSAEEREAQLKNINEKNPRQIKRMIMEFNDLISELEHESDLYTNPKVEKEPPSTKQKVIEKKDTIVVEIESPTIITKTVQSNTINDPSSLDGIEKGAILTGRYKGKPTTKQKIKSILNKKLW